MKLATLGDWCALLDSLRDRGAAGLDVTLGPGGEVTGLKCMLRPAVPARRAPEPVRDSSDDVTPPKPVPAGLGYMGV